jgi:hypothetical protein
MVTQACSASYLGGRARKIVSKAGKSLTPYLKNELKQKWLDVVWLKWQAACSASMRP